MICEACAYFTGCDCWADPNSVESCPPGRTCPKFEYEASYGKIAELERERCARICKARADAMEVDRDLPGEMCELLAGEARECERLIRGEK